jgi:hypothetical protein
MGTNCHEFKKYRFYKWVELWGMFFKMYNLPCAVELVLIRLNS